MTREECVSTQVCAHEQSPGKTTIVCAQVAAVAANAEGERIGHQADRHPVLTQEPGRPRSHSGAYRWNSTELKLLNVKVI